MKTNSLKLYDAVLNHDFAKNICFLCGDKSNEITAEHVIPKWLLNKFDLWNRNVTLLNKTVIPYKDYLIPCCETCNTNHLSKIESEVKSNFEIGAKAVMEMDRKTLLMWVLKIYYGFMYKELFLHFDRSKPQLGNILSPEDLRQYQILHYILQSTRVPMKFSSMDSDIPGSLFVFDIKDIPFGGAHIDNKFDYMDDVFHNSIYLRMGEVGILATFDMGAQNNVGKDFFAKYQDKKLHPLQFAELGANLFTKASTLERFPKIVFTESEGMVNLISTPIAGLSNNPVFGTWDLKTKGQILSRLTYLPMEVIMPNENIVITFLKNDNNEFRDIE